MSYNPDDYDEVYETKSPPEKTELLGNGWVLLDERFTEVDSGGHESFLKEWAETAAKGWVRPGGFWSGAARNVELPSPPQQETTYVLGWPKGQQTISEDDADRDANAPTARPTTASGADEASADTLPQASVAEGGPSESPDAPTAPAPPKGLDEV